MESTHGASELAHLTQMEREHAAWLDLVVELRERGAGQIEHGQPDYPLWAAITKWGEELAQLRLRDPNPDHADSALAEARDRYAGQYERGTYPDTEAGSHSASNR